jgi:hypothetical protein
VFIGHHVPLMLMISGFIHLVVSNPFLVFGYLAEYLPFLSVYTGTLSREIFRTMMGPEELVTAAFRSGLMSGVSELVGQQWGYDLLPYLHDRLSILWLVMWSVAAIMWCLVPLMWFMGIGGKRYLIYLALWIELTMFAICGLIWLVPAFPQYKLPFYGLYLSKGFLVWWVAAVVLWLLMSPRNGSVAVSDPRAETLACLLKEKFGGVAASPNVRMSMQRVVSQRMDDDKDLKALDQRSRLALSQEAIKLAMLPDEGDAAIMSAMTSPSALWCSFRLWLARGGPVAKK